jgi:hypothetical protein
MRHPHPVSALRHDLVESFRSPCDVNDELRELGVGQGAAHPRQTLGYGGAPLMVRRCVDHSALPALGGGSRALSNTQ